MSIILTNLNEIKYIKDINITLVIVKIDLMCQLMQK